MGHIIPLVYREECPEQSKEQKKGQLIFSGIPKIQPSEMTLLAYGILRIQASWVLDCT